MRALSIPPSGIPHLTERMRVFVQRWAASLVRRSRTLVAFLDVRMETLIAGWIAIVVLLGCCKVLFAPLGPQGMAGASIMVLPYLLIAIAPVAGYRIAAGSFPRGVLSAQPAVRLCRYGSWQALDVVSARQSRYFGAEGVMASLLLGIMLNVPIRTLEFIVAVPAIPMEAPGWARSLLLLMTADVIVMNFFYMVCAVMALRAVPLFPRMMLVAWSYDIFMQLMIAEKLSRLSDLPAPVAGALHDLLYGNIQKVLISAALWLPYLILSERVNVTYRRRVRA